MTNKQALDDLKAVLCDPEGKCCISGSDEDRRIIDASLSVLSRTRDIDIGKMKCVVPDDIDESNSGDIREQAHCSGYNQAIDDVMRSQDDLVEILYTLKQVLCVKG